MWLTAAPHGTQERNIISIYLKLVTIAGKKWFRRMQLRICYIPYPCYIYYTFNSYFKRLKSFTITRKFTFIFTIRMWFSFQLLILGLIIFQKLKKIEFGKNTRKSINKITLCVPSYKSLQLHLISILAHKNPYYHKLGAISSIKYKYGGNILFIT